MDETKKVETDPIKKVEVDVKELNELIALISEHNKIHEDQHETIVYQIQLMNEEHKKRYDDFYRLSQKILLNIKSKLNDHENRLVQIERNLAILNDKVM